MKPPLLCNPPSEGGSVVTAYETTASILAHRAGLHRPEEPDIGGSGARRPKPGGKAVAPKQGVGGLPRTLDLGAIRYRDLQRYSGEGQEQVTPKTNHKSNAERA